MIIMDDFEPKLFGQWDTQAVTVNDKGLVDYITLTPVVVPRSGGRHAKKQYHKSKMHVVERLMNKLFVAGHRGRKHRFTSGRNTGQTFIVNNIIISAFKDIEAKTKKNPVEVLVRAVENSAPLEEVLTYQRGGIMAREGVVTSPQRRVDLALRHLSQGTYQKSNRTKKNAWMCLSDEIMGAYKGDTNASFAASEKMRREKEALGAR